MSLVLVSFGAIFRDFGLTNAILRKGTITESEMSLVFWFNAVMTVAVTVALAASAPWIALFYNEPVVSKIILVSLAGFVISGLSLQHRALLNRELRFSYIAAIDSVGQLGGFLVTLVLALHWHSVWAIVYGTLVQTVLGSVGSVLAAKWWPSRPQRTEELGELLRFGANASVFSISIFAAQNAAALLIGRFLGAASLGQYNRAQQLFQLPITNLIEPIAQATMPLLTRLRQYPAEYRAAYLGLTRKLNTFLMPMSVILFFVGPYLVNIVLGFQWAEAGLVFAALAPAFAGMGAAYAIGDLFITQNRSAELRTLGLVELVIRVGAIVAGMSFGVVATAWSFSCSTLLVAVIRLTVAGRKGPVGVGDQLSAIVPGIPLACGAAVGSLLGLWLTDHMYLEDPFSSLAIISASGSGLAVVAGTAFATSRRAMMEVVHAFGFIAIARKSLSFFGRSA
ncbi:PST family polysaccharide transporter [Sphingomonas xinjiangensis]|uniref:PST family polysaccharide transporter n=2 Tax=Sphingomonas xinjiangensis TaxID=643568 RepID=A0A840YRG4_9SPHN|nr:PST family polysaccharide transporter [Sphingomonas xinjiangensis]